MFRIYLASALSIIVFVSASAPAQAQKTFKVCRGENADGCAGPFDAFIGCTEISQYVQNACPTGVGVRSVTVLSDRPGNRCGYTTASVVCNPEIAPTSILSSIAVILAGVATLLSIFSMVWVFRAKSSEDSTETTHEVGRRKFDINILGFGVTFSDPGIAFRFLAIIGGLLGLILSGIVIYYRLSAQPQHLGLLDLFIAEAFAAEPNKEVAGLIPYVAAGVLSLMGVSFLIALGTLLLLPDNKQNQARIKAADNIVKTFGGFFTGLATTLLK
jgi:hypothetical protein